MRPTKNRKFKSPKHPDTANSETAAAAETPAAQSTKPSKGTRGPGRRILSVSIPERLGRQVRLLCSVEGTSAQSIVEAALRRAVAKRLPLALAAISKTDSGDAEE